MSFRACLLVSALALAAFAPDAFAQPLTFSATNGIASPTTAPEAHVRLAWTATGTAGELYQIRRARVTAGVPGTFQVLAVRAETITEYLDTSALPGLSYRYILDATTSGRSGTSDGSRVLRRPDSATATDSTRIDGVRVTWADLSAVELGYVVFRSAPGAPQTVAGMTALDTTGVDGTAYLDATATTLQPYQYCVGLLDGSGGVRAVAEPLTCDVGTRGAVLPPAAVDASDGTFSDRVRVAWAPRTGVTFAVTRRAATIPRTTLASGLSGVSFDDLTALDGTLYTYCVTATSAVGTSVAACDTGRRGGLAPPTTVAATDATSDRAVDVSWVDAGPTETGFRIYRAPVAGGPDVLVTTTAANGTRYSDTSALPDVPYTYCVAAIAAATVGGATVVTESARVCDAGERSGLLPPVDFTATDGTPTDDEAATVLAWGSQSTAVQLFQILRDGAPIATLAPFDRGYRDATGRSGTTYSYRVRAVTVLSDNPDGLQQGLAPLFSRAAAEREALSRERTQASARGEAGARVRLDARAAALETALARDVQALLTGAGIDARALTDDTAAQAGLRDAFSDPNDGTRRVRAPGALTATTDLEDRIRLTWTDGSAIETAYEVRARYSPTDSLLVRVLPNQGAWTDLAAPAGSDVSYRVRAIDTDSTGTAQNATFGSNWVAVTGRRVLLPPGTVAARQVLREMELQLTWRDSSRAETGYVVSADLAGGMQTFTADANARGLAIPIQPADFGRAAAVTVRAVAPVASLPGLPSQSAAGTATATPTLLKPRVLTASTDYPDRVVVSWTDDSQANTGYRVTRGGVLLATLGDATTYTDTRTGEALYCVTPTGSGGPAAEPAPVCATGRTSTTTAASTGATITTPRTASGLNAVSGSANYGVSVAANGGAALAGAPNDAIAIAQGVAPGWAAAWPNPTTGSVFPLGTAGYAYGGVRSGVGVAAFYERSESGWTDVTRIQIGPDDPFTYGEFGRSVDVDGTFAIIGAPGAAEWITHPAAGPSQNGGFVYQSTVTWGDGGAYIYRKGSTGTWTRLRLLRGPGLPDNQLPTDTSSPSTSPPRPDAGVTRTVVIRYQNSDFRIDNQTTTPTTYTSAITRFGERVAITPEYAFATFRNGGAIEIGRYQANLNWTLQGSLTPPAGFDPAGNGALAAATGVLAVGSGASQRVHLHSVTAGGVTSTPVVIDTPSPVNARAFGSALAVEGDLLAVGAPLLGGAVYLYRKASGAFTWALEATLTDVQSGDVDFGRSVAIVNGFVTIGATQGGGGGVVYTFRRQGSAWLRAARLVPDASGTPAAARFGSALAASDDDVVIGAPGVQTGGVQTGAVYFATVGVTPSGVAASDGRYPARIQVRWNDESASEDGFRIYRRGPTDADFALVGRVGADQEVFDDFEVSPGDAYLYCVASYLGTEETNTNPLGESGRICDAGFTPANGTISGRLATGEGAGVIGAPVCLAPGPDQAVMFDGVGGSASVQEFSELPSSFTYQVWVNGDSYADAPLGTRAVMGLFPSFSSYALLRVLASGNPEFVVRLADGSESSLAATQPLVPGRWHHLSATVDNMGLTATLYVDGQPVVQNALAAAVNSPSGLFEIGQMRGERNFDGRIDDIRVWSRARTPAEIAAEFAAPRPLQGTEPDLFAYWAVDQGRGRILTDLTAGGRHALLTGGAEWTREGAPLNTCAVSDGNGNYAFNGLRYGTSTAFNVTPTDSTRQFTPAVRAATLTPASPNQNQVDFTDTSSYTVRGTVAHAFDAVRWPGQANVPAPEVDILVDGAVAGTSAADGTFAVAVRGARAHTFSARAAGHVFTAALAAQSFPTGVAAFTTLGDVDGLRFTNVRQDTLRGQAGGGCGLAVGDLTFTIYTEDRRFERTITTAGSQPYALPLPPLGYQLEYVGIANVQAPLVRTAVVQYFRNLGPLDADLTAGADTVDFRYRAPIALAVTGLGEPVASCSAGYRVVDAGGVERQLLPNVPVIAEYSRPRLVVSAFEDYGAGGRCPVDAGTVRIFDGFADATNTPVEVELVDGQATYRTFGRSPDTFSGRTIGGVDRSYQKSLTAVLEVPDGPTVTETVWAYVEGYREKPSTFVTATATEIPILILRDPPGTESSAFVEQGTTSCTSISSINAFDGATGIALNFKLGFKATVGFGISVESGGGFNIQAETLIGGGVTQTAGPPESNMQVCATTTERFETRGDTGWSGEDLYAGVGMNYVFAEADQLAADQTAGACRVRLSTTLAADVNAPDPFATTFVYGTTHITETLIPLLERRIRLAGPPAPGVPTGPAPETVVLTESLDNWRGMIRYDSLLTAAALAGEVENRSFSGGTTYSYGVTADTTVSTLREQRVAISTDSRLGGTFAVGGYDNFVLGVLQLKTEQTFGRATDNTTTLGTGYTLADSDAGDSFTVDVARDSTYGTYVFNTLSGASSNPWEPGTQKRDNPRIAIDPPVRTGVPDGQQALFTLSLTNASESNEPREYILDAPPHLNPDGASIRYQGDYLNERRVFVQPGQTISFPITVEPGPEETDYDLAIIAYSPFDHDIWRTAPQLGLVTSDTTRFSVSFTPLNAPVNLVEPEDGWRVTLAQDTLQISLDGLAIQNTNRERIGVELRRANEAWEDAISLRGDQIAVGAVSIDSVWTPRSTLADGVYEMRAFARRTEPDGTAAPAYAGPVVTGRIDRTAPVAFGLPEPADRVLALGETVGVTFTEAVDCPRLALDFRDGIATAGITPAIGAPPVVTLSCAERTVLIAPQDASAWAGLEGQLVTARLAGVRDLAGNPMAAEQAWAFTVRRNAFGWTPSIVAVNAQPNVPTNLPAALVNGRAQPVTFDLVPHTTDGLPFSFVPIDAAGAPTGGAAVRVTTAALSGTVVSGDVLPVAFRWPATAATGTYRATINVHSMEGTEDLGVSPLVMTVAVACQAPAWAVNPAAFETYMPVVAELRMAGETSADTSDVLAAFVNGQVRGRGRPIAYTSGGATVWRVPINVYGSGAAEQVTFKAWDQTAGAAGCVLHETTSQAIEFTANPVGSAQNPLVIEAPGAGGAPLAVPLARGWTWVSTNRAGTSTFASALAGVGSSETDLIQAADGFARYTPGTPSAWVGSISGMNPGQGYHINLAAPATMLHPGAPIDAATPIGILAGWNWIGYLPEVPLPIDVALASVTFTTDDMIKSQTQFAQYVEGDGWMGPLDTLQTGAGYQLHTEEDGTLTYPADGMRAGGDPWAARPVRRYDTLPVQVAPGLSLVMVPSGMPAQGVARTATARTTRRADTDRRTGRVAEAVLDGGSEDVGAAARPITDENPFEHSMTVTASLSDAADGVHIAAYAVTPGGEELRAVAPVQHIEALNGTRAFLLIPGAVRDSLVLRAVTDDVAGGWTPAGTLSVTGGSGPAAFGFVRDRVVGTAASPLALTLTGATAGEGNPLPAVLALSRIRPNPFSTVAEVEYALPTPTHVHLSMYDILGREVAVFADGERPAGVHALRLDARQLASGTYIIRLVAGAEVRIQRVTVTR